MKTIALAATLALCAGLITPAEAGFRFSARIGSADIFVGNSHKSVPRHHGTMRGIPRAERRIVRKKLRRGKRRQHPFALFTPHLLGGHHHAGHHHHEIQDPVPVEAPPAPVPPVAVAPAEPPPPPDPHGPLNLTPARGVAPAEAPYRVGEALPPGLPHVTLDWRQFDLPKPPPGRLYARVGRDVLLITASGRVVESIVQPG